ncbi:MAG: DUF2785 domain-containing protein [Acidobacteriota bacterium]|jgi:hypothetical protein
MRHFLAALVLLSLSGAASGGTARTHDAAYWRAVITGGYAVPEGESPAALIRELSGLLGSPDPEERDAFAYGIPARWIYAQELLVPRDLRKLVDAWSANLTQGIGETGDESVLLRSFSALDLSILAALDNKSPFLGRAGFRDLLDAALRYLDAERDLRGYVPGTGWHHAVAHGADLLKFLARSRHLTPAEQRRILASIRRKLDVGLVYVWGEDERLARAVLSLVDREDLDRKAFQGWLAALERPSERLWEGELDTARFMAVQNTRNTLRSLALRLETSTAPAAAWARKEVLDTLSRL